MAQLIASYLDMMHDLPAIWLVLAHRKLDAAVLDAYQWLHDLSDEELLARWLALNLGGQFWGCVNDPRCRGIVKYAG